MNKVPEWNVREFECAIDGYPPFSGSVTYVVQNADAAGAQASEQYHVAVTIAQRSFKFVIMRAGARWMTQMFAIHDTDGRVLGLHTLVLSNKRLEFLFEEALLKLAHFQEDEPE
jgi:hypothetical protein